MKLQCGDRVRFHEKVFAAPYAPYYDAYFGHTFVIAEMAKGHIRLLGPVKVDGWVHPDELEKLHE